MEEMYDFNSTSTYTISPAEYLVDNYLPFRGSTDVLSVAASVVADAALIETTPNQIILTRRRINGVDDDDDTVKDKIASHPFFSNLLDAYIDCQKVGAPGEVADLLDDVRKRNTTASTCLGIDPELDEFMETFYCLLVKYKSDIARTFDEATVFLGNIETQLRNLGIDEGGNSSSEEEASGGETQKKQELKDKLRHKFGGRISSLKQDFTKNRKKKANLPKEATTILLEWWNSHYKWPYPTEDDKIMLTETTGLDPKQVNNWFINQRKRHWNPSESMQLAIMGCLSGQYICDD